MAECKCCAVVRVEPSIVANVVANNVQVLEVQVKDATAEPNEVLQGAVFYNNFGRQIGELDEDLDLMQVTDMTYANLYGGEAISDEQYEEELETIKYWANIILGGV